jgi:hypothetical protein
MTENNRILVREGLKAYRIIPARYHTFLYEDACQVQEKDDEVIISPNHYCIIKVTTRMKP